MSYHDIRLPVDIERGSHGGPAFYTVGVVSPTGHSQRNQHWEDDLPKWNVGYGVQRASEFEAIYVHWLGRRGSAHSFPFRDHSDFRSGPVNTLVPTFQGNGDGVVDDVGFMGHIAGTADWQLIKTYGDSANPYYRQIFKPIVADVIVYVDATPVTVTHLGDGVFRFANADIPLVGEEITAQFEFDNPVRYLTDDFPRTLNSFNAYSAPSIDIVGVRPPNY